jgi:hypothetical protein
MYKINLRLILGLLMILAGMLSVFQYMNILSGTVGDIFGAVLLGAGGIIFMTIFVRRRWWWAAVPGISLLGLAAANILDIFIPTAGGKINGLIILGCIGLSFLVINYYNREHWWALIPSGIFITLGIADLVENLLIDMVDTSGIFFIGLGLTFLVLYFVPTTQGRIKWAVYPAFVLLAVGIFTGLSATALWNFVWPALIIFVGILFLYRTFRRA